MVIEYSVADVYVIDVLQRITACRYFVLTETWVRLKVLTRDRDRGKQV